MAQQYIFTMKELRKIVPPKREILKGIYLSFFPGAKIGVIGGNGAGKSTMLRIMAGVDKDFVGEAFPAEGTKIGYLPQEPVLDESLDVRGNVELGVKTTKDLLKRFEEVSNSFADPDADMDKLMAEQAKLQDKIDACNGWELDRQLDIAMDALRCPPGDAVVKTLSGGEKRRVALCKLLLEKPDMLLLDEPTNHLDAESVAWLERFLHDFPGTVVAITHDRYFLDNVAGWILELDRGAGIPWKGNYSSWLEQKGKRLADEEKQESSRQRQLARELEWVKAAPKARQAKSKARVAAYEELLKKSDVERKEDAIDIQIPNGPRLGDDVIISAQVTKGFGDNVLIDKLDFRLPRGGIVGVIGPNGAGKTTLFRMIVGQQQPDAGTMTVGPTVKLAYVDQSRDSIDPDKSVWQQISLGADYLEFEKRKISSRGYTSWFGFRGTDQQKLGKELSGGERNRLQLATTLRTGGNVLLLDEPTNDLDVDTLRALEEALLGFAGCAVVISHDRWFLDKIATHMLAFEGEGQVVWFEGNYQAYEADKKRRLGTDADQPHRLKYKKIAH